MIPSSLVVNPPSDKTLLSCVDGRGKVFYSCKTHFYQTFSGAIMSYVRASLCKRMSRRPFPAFLLGLCLFMENKMSGNEGFFFSYVLFAMTKFEWALKNFHKIKVLLLPPFILNQSENLTGTTMTGLLIQ